jgi:hypothetical protein
VHRGEDAHVPNRARFVDDVVGDDNEDLKMNHYARLPRLEKAGKARKIVSAWLLLYTRTNARRFYGRENKHRYI